MHVSPYRGLPRETVCNLKLRFKTMYLAHLYIIDNKQHFLYPYLCKIGSEPHYHLTSNRRMRESYLQWKQDTTRRSNNRNRANKVRRLAEQDPYYEWARNTLGARVAWALWMENDARIKRIQATNTEIE